MTKKTKILLGLILILGLGIRLYRLSIPDRPVFDENFFATFAADYAAGQPHFDVHPPLGKLIFSLPIFHLIKNPPQFVTQDESEKSSFYKQANLPFNDFPYERLRLISVFAGVGLILAIFWLVKNLSNSTAGLWAAFFVAIESLAIEAGRLITLDSLMLFFGFSALAIWFSRSRRKNLWAGLLWGLSLSVKLNAAIFLAPLIIQKIIIWKKGREENKIFNKRILIFFITGFIVLFFFWVILNNLLIPPSAWLKDYATFLPQTVKAGFNVKIAALPNLIGQVILFLGSAFVMINFSLNGYLDIGGTHPNASPWYGWLIGQKPILLFNAAAGDGFFLINPLLEFLVLASLVFFLIRFWKNRKKPATAITTGPIILAGSYILSFLPFILVQRPTFIYHYLPGMIFGLCLMAIVLENLLAKMTAPKRKTATIVIVAISLISFILTAPYIYGLPPILKII